MLRSQQRTIFLVALISIIVLTSCQSLGNSELPTLAVLPTLPPTETSVPIPATNTPKSVDSQSINLDNPTPLPAANIETLTERVPEQVVIQFAPDSSQDERTSYITSIGGEIKGNINVLNTFVITVSEQVASQSLPDSPFVVASEPDYYATALLDINIPTSDPHFAEQWALPMIGALDAWLSLPEVVPSVTVAVIDSGVCLNHSDLAGRIQDTGRDFVDQDYIPLDEFGHGCAVSGIIAANIDNGIGIAGVAPNTQIMPLRVLDAQGIGTYSDVAAAIVYAADNGADIINLSLGGVNSSSVLENAVNYAVSNNVLVIAASGNSGAAQPLYPAIYSNVIAVGSVDANGQPSSFSNQGVDTWAPGRDITMLWLNNGYATHSGTSFAAPYVAGVAAVKMALGEELTFDGSLLSFNEETTNNPTPTATVDEPAEPTPTVDPNDLPDEVERSGWLGILFGHPTPESDIPTQMIVQLADSEGFPVAELVLDYSTARQFSGKWVTVSGQRISSQAQGIEIPVIQVETIEADTEANTNGSDLNANLAGSKPYINILCKFSDIATEPHPPSWYQGMFGSSYPGLDHYWRQISYDNINLVGTATVTQWFVLPHPRSYYVQPGDFGANKPLLAQDCAAAADSSVYFPQYFGINFQFNANLDCCAWGNSYVPMTLDGQTKGYAMTWGAQWLDTMAHEMGHAFGLPHSSGPADNPPSGLDAYTSRWDVMSAGGTCAYTDPDYFCIPIGTISYHLDMNSWLPANRKAVIDYTTQATITLEQTVFPQSSTNYLMAQIPINGSSDHFYTVEVRNLNGYDQSIPGKAVIIHDVLINRPNNNTGDALVVDADDGNDDVNDAGGMWIVGETFYDATNDITISILSSGPSSFTVRINNHYIPPNDDFDNARIIDSIPYNDSNNSTDNATTAGDDPIPSCSGGVGKTVWYRYTAPSNDIIRIETAGSDFDTVLSVWTGTRGNLTEAACNDDVDSGAQSQLEVAINAGTTYYVMVNGFGGVGGNLILNASHPYTIPNGDVSSLIAAINTANINPDVDVIYLTTNGTYILNSEYAAGNGLPAITSEIVIIGQGATITRSGGAPAFRVFQVDLSGDLTLNNLTISNGFADGDVGGGIQNAGNLTLLNATLANNNAGWGGGLSNTGIADISDSLFTQNTSINTGGAIDIGGVSANLTLSNSVISTNTSDWGGGLFIWDGTTTINATTFLENIANDTAGGIGVNGGSLTLTNSFIRNNHTITGMGGGLANWSTSHIDETVFSGNFANMHGGAIRNEGTLQLSDSVINNNQTLSGVGGGLSNYDGLSTVRNTAFLYNFSFSGGGIHNDVPLSGLGLGSLAVQNAGPDGHALEGTGIGNSTNPIRQNGTVAVQNNGDVGAASTNGIILTEVTVANNNGFYGAGVYNYSGEVELIRSTVSSNHASYDGGGVLSSTDGTVLLNSASKVINNSAVFSGGGMINYGTINIDNSALLGNTTLLNDGGGITNYATLVTVGSMFQDNYAAGSGGGIYNNGSATITSTDFLTNSAYYNGGALVNAVAGDTSITGGSFDANDAGYNGGAASNWDGDLSINGTMFSNNDASYDGGAVQYFTNDGTKTITIDNSSFNNNNANYGGAVHIHTGGSDLSPLTINNSSFVGNTVYTGGGAILANSEVSVNNSCIVGNDDTAVYNGYITELNATGNWWGTADGPSGNESGSGDSVSPQVDASSFLAASILGCPWFDSPPDLTVNNTDVILDEGQTAVNDGTVDDIDGDTVTLTSSIGIPVNHGDGNWSWSYDTDDGPSQSQTVTITADDGQGGIEQATFELTVNNVPPIATFVNTTGTVKLGQAAVLDFSNHSDPSVADTSNGFIHSYDCENDEAFEIIDTILSTQECTYPVDGVFTAKGLVGDKDGEYTEYTTDVTVIYEPSNLIAVLTPGLQIDLMWTDNSSSETAVHIERSPNGSTDWVEIDTVAADVTAYSDTGLPYGITYYYRVRVFRGGDGQYSAYSNVSTATIPTPTFTPTITYTPSPTPAPVTSVVGLYNDGIWTFRDSNNTGVADIRFMFGPQESGWQPFVGDWDGDGVDGIGLYKDGIWALRNSSDIEGTVDFMFNFGTLESGWQAVVGDWDGDQIDSVGLYKDGLWLLRNSNSTGAANTQFNFRPFGKDGKAIAGDWDNNGIDTVGLYADGIFYLAPANENTPDRRGFMYGPQTSGWLPVAGDWNEDGIDTIGLYLEGAWRLRNWNSQGAADINFNFYEPGVPISGYRGGASGLMMLSIPPSITQPSPSPTIPVIAATATATNTVVPLDVTVELTLTQTAETIISTSTLQATITPTVEPTLLPPNTATTLPTVTVMPPTNIATLLPTAIATPTILPSATIIPTNVVTEATIEVEG